MLRRKFRSWGFYDNKDASIVRLIEQFKNLDSSAKKNSLLITMTLVIVQKNVYA